MVNAIYGIATAKSMGNKCPKVGILNVDGARQVEKCLRIKDNGYDMEFADSIRADGGCVMRGNDLQQVHLMLWLLIHYLEIYCYESIFFIYYRWRLKLKALDTDWSWKRL